MNNFYESDKILQEYLLFHYGSPEEILPYAFGPHDALDFAARSVSETVDRRALESESVALDLGCAVGRAAFELARHCTSVLGIDASQKFVETAMALQRDGELPYLRKDEGALSTPLVARVPESVERARVRFEKGDAMELRRDLPMFDVVLLANLIDRLPEPTRCLRRLPGLVKPRGQLIVISPYTWLEQFTPPDEWLGGRFEDGRAHTTLDGLKSALSHAFTLVGIKDLPFLIREHARKFQWSVAQATMWIRKDRSDR